MNFITHSHRFGLEFLESPDSPDPNWAELKDTLKNISDEDIIQKFYSNGVNRGKSISISINEIIRERLSVLDWLPEANIFNPEDENHPDPSSASKRFRLDFAKKDIAVEVAFNHGEAISWNLLKPVLSSELNHVQKEVQTKIGVIITATENMKKSGGFDGAVGTYEKFLRYLIMMNTQLVCPIVIVGLDAPTSFKIKHYTIPSRSGKLGLVYQNGKRIVPSGEEDFAHIQSK